MKRLAPELAEDFFAEVSRTREVLLPVLLSDGTRAFGRPGDGPLALHGGVLPASPTAPFFPQRQAVFTAGGDGSYESPAPGKPLFVAGFTPRDLACLRFVDRFFAEGWRDDVYFRRRNEAVVAGVSGYCGPGGKLIAMAGGDCDLEFVWDGAQWLVLPYTDAGIAIVAPLPEAAPHALDWMRDAVPDTSDEEEIMLQAARLVQSGEIPDCFWEEIGYRCIACTGCNCVCPTCTCFGVQDWAVGTVESGGRQVERSRMWDSCQLDGFMREASGHNPLGTQALRTRRRIHHKLAADLERWGEMGCFLCGRCDAVCPTGIGMMGVAREMVSRFGGGEPLTEHGGAA